MTFLTSTDAPFLPKAPASPEFMEGGLFIAFKDCFPWQEEKMSFPWLSNRYKQTSFCT